MDTSVSASLSPEVVIRLVSKHRDGLAVKDYATEAGISSNNAAVRVFRAREALQKHVTSQPMRA